MAEHRPGSPHVEVPCITLTAIPTVYALHDPDVGVLAWVFALPGGKANIVSSDDGVLLARTTMDLVASRWAPLKGGDLVAVTARCG